MTFLIGEEDGYEVTARLQCNQCGSLSDMTGIKKDPAGQIDNGDEAVEKMIGLLVAHMEDEGWKVHDRTVVCVACRRN